ncbi:HU family DNA-binding protein [Alteromonas sp. 14N.309.X.WAT.G.H12]|uniref:HU family DNA-binding protein n=1 Tax=Alteromonas sp. 14N.309.X.WAT.G.H12 TaxID=3120824 RepID=UPI002FD45BE7
MNKSELIAKMSEKADIPKKTAADALEAYIASVTEALKKDDSVALIGFGTFSVKERSARSGRNPQTGATIEIPAKKNPIFKAGTLLKDACN